MYFTIVKRKDNMIFEERPPSSEFAQWFIENGLSVPTTKRDATSIRNWVEDRRANDATARLKQILELQSIIGKTCGLRFRPTAGNDFPIIRVACDQQGFPGVLVRFKKTGQGGCRVFPRSRLIINN